MRIADIRSRLATEFGRISTSNQPSVDDGGGVFLTTVAQTVEYFIPFNTLSAFPTVMIVAGEQKYSPVKASSWKDIQINADFWIYGVVKSDTGTTSGKINGDIACNNLINDCVRVAISLFTSDINASGTRFIVNAVNRAVTTFPMRFDEAGNLYWFSFPLAIQTLPCKTI